MDPRFAQLPAALRERSLITRFAGSSGQPIPVLLAHPSAGWHLDAEAGKQVSSAPVVVWLHGRTANKELDPGRYLRWVRAGVAACAIDLPGHGERTEPAMQEADRSVGVIAQAVAEIDSLLSALGDSRWRGAFDTSRAALGGMSLGGMAALARLCRPHSFTCGAVEAAAGSYDFMRSRAPWNSELAASLEPIGNLTNWRPIPLFALHSEADRWVPVTAMRSFTDALKKHYSKVGADPGLVELHTWPETGAPNEHYGFGRVSNEAKNMQTAFFARVLGAGGPIVGTML